MKKQILFLLPLALLLWGCPVEKEDDTPEPDKHCRLQETTYEVFRASGDLFLTSTTRYSYNNQGQLATVYTDSAGMNGQTQTLRYDSQGRLVEVSSPSYTYQNEYNTQNQRIKQLRSYSGTDGALQPRDYYTFSYNSRNELQEAHYYYMGNGTPTLYGTWRYTYTNGDPTTIVHQPKGTQQEISFALHYDNKKRPPQHQLHTFFQPIHAPSEHNFMHYEANPTDHQPKYTSSYTYNSQDYPVTWVKTYAHGEKDYYRYTYSNTCQ